MQQFEYKGRIYTVTNCTKEDIPSHIERVLSYWQDCHVNVEEQKEALKEAVENNTAFKVVNDLGEDEASIYYIRENPWTGISNLLFFNNKRVFVILGYYLRIFICLTNIYFLPHTKNYIPFEFIVEDSSIRLFHSDGTPLEIDLYSKKSQMLYEDHYVKHNIQVL